MVRCAPSGVPTIGAPEPTAHGNSPGTCAVVPVMLEGGAGSIVNVASEAGLRGNASGNAYTTSKHGVIGLSADEDPSAATLIALADMMESSGIFSVMVDPVYKQSYGQALKSDLESRTDHTVTILEVFLALGPYKDPSGNADYLDQLQRNLVSLKAGLGVA